MEGFMALKIPKEYYGILENVDGLIIVDAEGKIVYLTNKVASLVHITQEEAIGKPVKEIVYTTTLDNVLKTGKADSWEFYFAEGHTIVSNRRPIYIDGELQGALEYDIFQNPDMINGFFEKVNTLSEELDKYKLKVNNATYSINNILGDGPTIKRLKGQIEEAARSNSTVLIQGETGTGKELVAHAIHRLSQRSFAPFVKLNCATFPKDLIESELFGYEEGAFTGAKAGGKKGKFELANGGTIFLDEVNQLSLEAQPKLLRVLQEREITKIGGDKTIPTDVRIIVASNKKLIDLVQADKFREDLYYRFNVLEINIPPLRSRKEDIPILVYSIVKRMNKFLNKNIPGISPEVFNLLMDYDWPGNVRELENILERAMNRCEYDEELDTVHFEDFLNYDIIQDLPTLDIENLIPYEEAKQSAEKNIIENALKVCKGNKSKAAKALEISRTLLHRKINKYDIK